jgi:hypothetical protein
MKISSYIYLVACTSLLCIACGGTHTRLASSMEVKAKQGDASELVAKGDRIWKKRDTKAKARKAIKIWKAAAKMDPTRADIALKLAYAYYFMANVHARWEDDADEKRLALYKKGTKAAETAIFLQNSKFQQALSKGKKWEEYVSLIEKDGIASLYWYCSNLGQYSVLEGITTAIGNLSIIKSSMKHILSLDENFFYAGPHRYFGAYEAKVVGGNLDKAKVYFNRSIKLAPDYLDTYILKAEWYAAKTQDEDLFVATLKQVLKADVNAIPNLKIENSNAQRIAKSMLENMEDYF